MAEDKKYERTNEDFNYEGNKRVGDVGLDNITNLIANLCHHSLKRGCVILGCAHTNTN